jgi:hypothetical protein
MYCIVFYCIVIQMYYFRRGAFCRFILHNYFILNLQISAEVTPSLTHLVLLTLQSVATIRPAIDRDRIVPIYYISIFNEFCVT